MTKPMSEALIQTKGQNLEVTASLPHEMQQCQTALMQWCQHKIASIRETITEANAEMEIAVKNKWRSSGWKKRIAMDEKRIVFFGKIMAALKAGYSIVPNFPITLFAVRTSKAKPTGNETTSNWATFEQSSQALEIGKGTYQNPFPVIWQRPNEVREGDKLVEKGKKYWPKEWGEMEFPVAMAKPAIMGTTAEAMKSGIFDQFGICPPTKRTDPMIIAQVIDPKPRGYSGKQRVVVSFLIAWRFETALLD